MLMVFFFLCIFIGVTHITTPTEDRCIQQQEPYKSYLITPSFDNTIRVSTCDKNTLIKSIPIFHHSWTLSHFFKSELPPQGNLNLFTSEEFQYAPNCEMLADHLETSNEGNVFLIMEKMDETTHINFIDDEFLLPSLRKNYKINFEKSTIEKCHNTSATICRSLQCSTKELFSSLEDNSQKIVNVAWKMQKEQVEIIAQLPNKLLHCRDTDEPLKLEFLNLYHNTTQHLYIGSYSFLQTKDEGIKYTMEPTFSLDKTHYVLLIVKMCNYCEMTISLLDDEEVIQESHLNGSDYPIPMLFDDQIDTSEWQEVILGANENCKTCRVKIATKTINDKKGLWVIAEELKIITRELPTEDFSCELVERDYELNETFYDKRNALEKRFGKDFLPKVLFYKQLYNGENLCMKVKNQIYIKRLKVDGVVLLEWWEEDVNAPYEYRIAIKNANNGQQIMEKSHIVAYDKADSYIDVVILPPSPIIMYEATISSPTSEGKLLFFHDVKPS